MHQHTYLKAASITLSDFRHAVEAPPLSCLCPHQQGNLSASAIFFTSIFAIMSPKMDLCRVIPDGATTSVLPPLTHFSAHAYVLNPLTHSLPPTNPSIQARTSVASPFVARLWCFTVNQIYVWSVMRASTNTPHHHHQHHRHPPGCFVNLGAPMEEPLTPPSNSRVQRGRGLLAGRHRGTVEPDAALYKPKHTQDDAPTIVSGCSHEPGAGTCLEELILWKTPAFSEDHAVHPIYLYQTENFKYCDQDAQINNLPSGLRVPRNYVDLKWLCISHSRLAIFSLLTVTMCFLTHTLTIFYFLKPQSLPNQNRALVAMCRCCRKAALSQNACFGSLNMQLVLFLPSVLMGVHSSASNSSTELHNSQTPSEQKATV